MGPLQVLYDTIDEPLYDGQYCLAQKTCNIVWQVLFKYYISVVKHRNSRYCLARTPVLRGVSKMLVSFPPSPSGRSVSDGCMTCG